MTEEYDNIKIKISISKQYISYFESKMKTSSGSAKEEALKKVYKEKRNLKDLKEKYPEYFI